MQIGFVVKEAQGVKYPRPWARMGEKVILSHARPYVQHYPHPNVVEAKKTIQAHALIAMRKADLREPVAEAVEVFMVFYFVKPPSRIRKHSDPHPFPTVKPDSDNHEKLVLDALSKVVYLDDQYVVDTHVAQRYVLDGPAHTFIGVKTMDDWDAQNPLTIDGNTCRGFQQFYPQRGMGF